MWFENANKAMIKICKIQKSTKPLLPSCANFWESTAIYNIYRICQNVISYIMISEMGCNFGKLWNMFSVYLRQMTEKKKGILKKKGAIVAYCWKGLFKLRNSKKCMTELSNLSWATFMGKNLSGWQLHLRRKKF